MVGIKLRVNPYFAALTPFSFKINDLSQNGESCQCVSVRALTKINDIKTLINQRVILDFYLVSVVSRGLAITARKNAEKRHPKDIKNEKVPRDPIK